MQSNTQEHGSVHENELLITRVFNAPRKLVWEVWTQQEHIAQWWGPRGFTTRVEKLDLRPGGQSVYIMIGPDGKEYPGQGVFKEIVPLERIIATDDFGEDFKAATDIDLPQGIVTTTIFEDIGDAQDKTRVTVRIMHPNQEEKRKHEKMGVVGGWNSMLDCLVDYLQTLG